MAAPFGAPALPRPAPAPAILAALFADGGKDPTGGNWAATMAAFAIDPHNNANTTNTLELRQMATSATTASDKSAGYVIVSGGVGRFFTALLHW